MRRSPRRTGSRVIFLPSGMSRDASVHSARLIYSASNATNVENMSRTATGVCNVRRLPIVQNVQNIDFRISDGAVDDRENG